MATFNPPQHMTGFQTQWPQLAESELDAADDHASPDVLSLTEYSQEGISGSMTKCPQFRTYACSDGVLPEESSDGAGNTPSRGGFRSLDRGKILDTIPGKAALQPK